jgi:hypothetical protein
MPKQLANDRKPKPPQRTMTSYFVERTWGSILGQEPDIRSVRGQDPQEALWVGGIAFCLIAAMFAGMLLYFRIRHGPRITRRRLDPRLKAEQSIFDGAGLLIVGRFAPDRVLIQDAATQTEIAAHEVRAVSLRERYGGSG